MQQLAVILLSGGMDSATIAAIAKRDGYELAALHLNYGQRTEAREFKSFSDLCDYFDIKHRLVVDIKYLSQIGGSSLTDFNINVEKGNLDNTDIPATYVPFRNANILAIATSWSEVIGAKALFIGAMEGDSSGYPDCRKSFFDAFQDAINLGTKPETKIEIKIPIINFSKSDIVKKGLELNVPFELTWSCYQNSEIPCGECDSCLLRKRGFDTAEITDPLT